MELKIVSIASHVTYSPSVYLSSFKEILVSLHMHKLLVLVKVQTVKCYFQIDSDQVLHESFRCQNFLNVKTPRIYKRKFYQNALQVAIFPISAYIKNSAWKKVIILSIFYFVYNLTDQIGSCSIIFHIHIFLTQHWKIIHIIEKRNFGCFQLHINK